MYDDPGHGPLGLKAGVSITVGLPMIRTSVDHGTAFDNEGTGKADPASLEEAVRQAIMLSGTLERHIYKRRAFQLRRLFFLVHVGATVNINGFARYKIRFIRG